MKNWRSRHRDHAPRVGLVVELGFDLVAGIAGSPAGLVGLVLGEWISALDHEVLDDAMETRSIVEAFLGERLEILNGLGCHLRPKLNDHGAFAGFDDCYFLRIHFTCRFL